MVRQKPIEDTVKNLLLENYQSYYRLAYSYVKNQDDAMDIVQESAYRVMKKCHTVKEENYAATWIYRVVVNTALDFIRKNKRETLGVEENESIHEDRYRDFDVMDSLQRLEEKDRTIVVLKYFEEMKLDEIAKITGENINTVKTRLYRALKKLKIVLAD